MSCLSCVQYCTYNQVFITNIQFLETYYTPIHKLSLRDQPLKPLDLADGEDFIKSSM